MKKGIVYIVTSAVAVFIVILFVNIRSIDKNQSETISTQDIKSSTEPTSLQDSQQSNTNSFFYTDWDNMYQQNPYYVGQIRWVSGFADMPVIRNTADWSMTHAFNMAESEYTVPFMTEDEYLHDHNLIIYAYNRNHNEKAKASVLSQLSDSDILSKNRTFYFYLADSYFSYEITEVKRITEEEISGTESTCNLLILVSGEEKPDGYIAILADKTGTVSYE